MKIGRGASPRKALEARAMPRNAPKEDRGLLIMFCLCQEQLPRSDMLLFKGFLKALKLLAGSSQCF